MTVDAEHDWNPGAYDRFRGLRLRPGIDLLRAVGGLPDGPVTELGCGSGAVGPALAQLQRPLTGIDLSPAMLAAAQETGVYDTLVKGDAATWAAPEPQALIFSNAALQWAGDHQVLLPRLAGMLADGGVLAVQMPHQNKAPSHRLWMSLADELFPERFDTHGGPGVLPPVTYQEILSPLGQFDMWETEYYQVLPPDAQAHPVRRFTEPTYARPILQALSTEEQAQLIAAYEDVIGSAYHTQADGSVLFPFRRLFFTLRL
ncbi:MAG: methyltransferase domain-containing protein [Paracoccaceae bacterium]|nr:methyltransferase domain-containing protein [Paracoccaceae bacterium]